MAGIVADIVYQGDNSTFIWKSPIEDFNTGALLTVHASQEAVFFMNGQALDVFGPGRHSLETQNIPLLKRLFNLPVGGQTPFHCQVYFVNKTYQPEIRWGTDSPIMYTDPKHNFSLTLGASGTMILRVDDSCKLLVKLVGTETYLGQDQLASMLRSIVVANAKQHLAKVMSSGEFSITDVDARILDISEAIKVKLEPEFAAYGFSMERFLIGRWALPEDNPRYRFILDQEFQLTEARQKQNLSLIAQQTEAQKTIIEAQGLAQKRQIEGYTYQQEQSFEVSKLAAQNEGAGNFSSAGIGLGMMSGIAGGMGGTIAGITANAMAPIVQMPITPAPQAAAAQAPQPAAVPPADEMAVLKQKIEKLKLLKESGMLSDEEFEAEKKKLLLSL